MRSFLFLMLTAAPLAAQMKRYQFGVTGGVALTDPVGGNAITRSESRRYAVGVSMETFLNEHVSLDTGLLFKRTGSTTDYSAFRPLGLAPDQLRLERARQRGLSWETPVIGKYTFGGAGRTWRPFVGAGFALRMSWESNEALAGRADGTGPSVRSSYDSRSALDAGAVFSGGIRGRAGRFTWTPEIRYTRWGYAAPPSSRNRNQAEVLFTVRF